MDKSRLNPIRVEKPGNRVTYAWMQGIPALSLCTDTCQREWGGCMIEARNRLYFINGGHRRSGVCPKFEDEGEEAHGQTAHKRAGEVLRRRCVDAPALVPARRVGPHGHQVRLRHR